MPGAFWQQRRSLGYEAKRLEGRGVRCAGDPAVRVLVGGEDCAHREPEPDVDGGERLCSQGEPGGGGDAGADRAGGGADRGFGHDDRHAHQPADGLYPRARGGRVAGRVPQDVPGQERGLAGDALRRHGAHGRAGGCGARHRAGQEEPRRPCGHGGAAAVGIPVFGREL